MWAYICEWPLRPGAPDFEWQTGAPDWGLKHIIVLYLFCTIYIPHIGNAFSGLLCLFLWLPHFVILRFTLLSLFIHEINKLLLLLLYVMFWKREWSIFERLSEFPGIIIICPLKRDLKTKVNMKPNGNFIITWIKHPLLKKTQKL